MPVITFFNTLGRSMEEFKPLVPGKVGFYGCGPTVYNYAHIGNLRTYVFEDILVRSLRRFGLDVTHVMNITDVGHLSGDDDSGEDKMLRSAKERGQSVLQIASYYTDAFFADTERLGIARPDVVCKATEHVQDMIRLIRRIEAGGYTYSAGGNLYFDVSKFPRYGELANLRLEELKAGARIEVDENKKNPQDFVLWFTKSKFENQALIWDSPWGRGYPGWHVECSAMSMKYLGESFDIHAGGVDHIPVHHTNEIAQSEAATGKPWVRYWLHAEFLVMDKGKMSKSKGNFITLQNLLDGGFEALDYRYFCLGGHYRSQLSFSDDAMAQARASRKAMLEKFLDLRTHAGTAEVPNRSRLHAGVLARLERFDKLLAEDLAVPRALAELWGLLKDPSLPPADVVAAALDMDTVLGIGLAGARREEKSLSDEERSKIQALVDRRTEAKKAKNWAEADALRQELKDLGIVLEDGPRGTVWKQLKA
ncbi:Cysteine--tRNA ligase [bioreactor metagenome]|uniref:Cysteine--tRNA ligase n=1 Tax=bioreactor metagenome TaxID=1076179 RepID=A0A644TG03_9ZZZZ